MKTTQLIGVTVAAALAAAPAGADIMYLSQQRTVLVAGFVNGVGDGGIQISAPDFGEFNHTRTHMFSQNTGVGVAYQQSRLLPNEINFDGLARIQVTDGLFSGEARSRMVVAFAIDSESPFHVEHAHSSTGGPFSGRLALARLTGPAGVVFEWAENFDREDSWPDGPREGVLPSGQYTLEVDLYSHRGSQLPGGLGTAESTASLRLIIPAPPGALGLALAAAGMRRGTRRANGIV